MRVNRSTGFVWISAVMLVACGGGLSGAMSLAGGDGGNSLSGVSVNATEAAQALPAGASAPPASGNAIRRSVFEQCADGQSSPADMTKLGCLVGRLSGYLYANKQVMNTACAVEIQANGQARLAVPGQHNRQHQFSNVPFDEQGDGSLYRYNNKGSTVYDRGEAFYPAIKLVSQIRGSQTGNVWHDAYGVGLFKYAPSAGTAPKHVWAFVSIIDGQQVECTGLLPD